MIDITVPMPVPVTIDAKMDELTYLGEGVHIRFDRAFEEHRFLQQHVWRVILLQREVGRWVPPLPVARWPDWTAATPRAASTHPHHLLSAPLPIVDCRRLKRCINQARTKYDAQCIDPPETGSTVRNRAVISDDLPAPERPHTPTLDPASTTNDTSLSAKSSHDTTSSHSKSFKRRSRHALEHQRRRGAILHA